MRGFGSIVIGEQERRGFVVRAIGQGTLDFEDGRPKALVVLETGLVRWFEGQGIDAE